MASRSSFFVIPSGAACSGKEVRIFRLGARERAAYVSPSQHLNALDNHLALSDLRGFIAKITASLVTRFKGH
jgi:hypothetical protein